jgi:hypothetical protein
VKPAGGLGIHSRSPSPSSGSTLKYRRDPADRCVAGFAGAPLAHPALLTGALSAGPAGRTQSGTDGELSLPQHHPGLRANWSQLGTGVVTPEAPTNVLRDGSAMVPFLSVMPTGTRISVHIDRSELGLRPESREFRPLGQRDAVD